jgi:hypothetical protein
MEGPLHLSTGRDRGPATTSVPLWKAHRAPYIDVPADEPPLGRPITRFG